MLASRQSRKFLLDNRLCFYFTARFSTDRSTKVEFTNGIKHITMCNQKARNALSISMMQSLLDNIKNDQQNLDLRVIVISGEGPAFSAGHNLKELADNRENQKTCFKIATELMNTIIDSPVPVIAKVDGLSAAAGCQLVAQCDIALCTERSTFSTPGANFGIFCSTPGIALARTVNKMSSMHMLLTGLPISGKEAKQIGLVTRVCPSTEELDKAVDITCSAIKSKSRCVIELGKRFYYKQIQYDVRKAYELGGEKMVENLQLADCQEGIQSFIEKRKPQWSQEKN